MFTLTSPKYFYLLLVLLPLVVALFLLAKRARKRKMARFGREANVTALTPDVSRYKPWVRLGLQLALIVLIVVILVRPRGNVAQQKHTVNGIEVMVLLDVSNSMLASSTDDVTNPETRLQQAKRILEKLFEQLKGNKVGIVSFAGEAQMEMPMTADLSAAKMNIDRVSPNAMRIQGTDIGSAIRMTRGSFSTKRADISKAVIVITDGEDHEQDAERAAKAMKEKGIQVNVIGVGSPRPTKIPVGGGYLTDNSGNVVTTQLNEDMCADLAKEGGGVYVHGSTANAAAAIMDSINSLEKTQLGEYTYDQQSELYTVFAWLALVVLVALMMLLDYKNPWLSKIKIFGKNEN